MLHTADWSFYYTLLLFLPPLLYYYQPRVWINGELVTSAMMNELRDSFLDIESGNIYLSRIWLDSLTPAEYSTVPQLSIPGTAAIAYLNEENLYQSLNGVWWTRLSTPSPVGWKDIWLAAKGSRPYPPYVGYPAQDVEVGQYIHIAAVPFNYNGVNAVYWDVVLPRRKTANTSIYVSVYWFNMVGGAGTVMWALQTRSFQHQSPLNQSVNQSVAIYSAALPAKQLCITPPVLIDISFSIKGDLTRFFFFRNDATYNGVAYLLGVLITIPTDQPTDDWH